MKVLDIPLYDKGLDSGIDEIINSYKEGLKENRCISATGAHGLVYSKQNQNFKKVLKSFYMNLPDGMPGVWLGRFKGAKNMTRCYGPDFFKGFIESSAKNNEIKHFFCGGKEGVAEELLKVSKARFGNNNIVGTFCPPFKNVNDYRFDEIAEQIKRTGANFVWIGLSTPKQELFANYLSKYTDVNYIACVGAAFDFHIGAVRQAPKWIQNIGLEWFFRLVMEPSRLWKRYFEIVPLFIYYNFAELFSGNFNKN